MLEDSAAKLGAEPAPAPVLSWAAFRALCEAPPLQARTATIKHNSATVALAKFWVLRRLEACARRLRKPAQA